MPDGSKCLSFSYVRRPSSVLPVEAAQQIRDDKTEETRDRVEQVLREEPPKADHEIPTGKWEETKGGVEFGNLLNSLPDDLRRNIKRQLCLDLLLKTKNFLWWLTEVASCNDRDNQVLPRPNGSASEALKKKRQRTSEEKPIDVNRYNGDGGFNFGGRKGFWV
ncbi:hypothetical protein EZV62_009069 [Acer yangbiense]|uniref:Uncharacterized protein n=1 Tax=Acer yangbiense TaxID=1000413 RepID=A0A5C7IFL8_9ROSI|nr:hypothetical protein EZV62_009069 [Acer yangbiense]